MAENPTNAGTVYVLNATSIFHDVLFNSIVNAAPGAVKIPYIVYGVAMNQIIGQGITANTSPQLNAVVSNIGLVTTVAGLGAGLVLPAATAVAVGLVAAGVGVAVSTALTVAYDISDDFRSDFDNYVDDALVAVGDVAEWVGDIYRDMANVVNNLPSDIEAAKDAVADYIENRFENLKTALEQTYNDIGNALDNALVDLGRVLDAAGEIANDVLNGDYDNLSDDVLGFLDGLFGSPGNPMPVSDAISDAGGLFGKSFISPLVFDFSGASGLQLTPLSGSQVFYDLDGDGFVEHAGWTSQEGFLVHDANGNGVIDNQSEMFGEDATGSAWDKLTAYDTNGNGSVEGAERDALRIWIDANGNGRTDTGELKTLQQAGVAANDNAIDGAYGGCMLAA